MHHNQQDNSNYNNRRQQYHGDNYQSLARHNTGYNHPHPHGGKSSGMASDQDAHNRQGKYASHHHLRDKFPTMAPRDLAVIESPSIQLDDAGDGLPLLTLKNSLSKISFCDKECYNVNNNKTKEQILKYIQKKHNINIIEKQYVILNPHMMRNISFHEHLLATYTNGNPYILYLTRIDGLPCSIYIDRKLKEGYSYPKIHCVQYKFDSNIFDQDTIFTGELVRDINRNWQFLISDILVHEGQDTKAKNILAKFQLIHNILENQFQPDVTTDICPLVVKRLFQYSEIRTLIEDFIPNLSYICKGVVFYTMNTQFSDYAWVLPKENQVNVLRKHEVDQAFYTKYPEYLKYKDIEINQLPFLDSSQSTGNKDSNTTYTGKGSLDSYCTPGTGESTVHPMFKSRHIFTGEPQCFTIMRTEIPDIYYLYTTDNRTAKIGTAFIMNLATSQMLHNHFKNSDSNSQLDTTVKCYYHMYFDRWIPYEITTDTPSLNTEQYQVVYNRFRNEIAGTAEKHKGD